MDLTINITNLDKLVEALNNLATAFLNNPTKNSLSAAQSQNSPANPQINQPAAAPTYPQPPQQTMPFASYTGLSPASSVYSVPLVESTPVPAPVAPTNQPSFAPAPAPAVPTTAAQSYTVDQLSTAAAALRDAGKLPQLQALLQQFGIPNLTALPRERYGEFATALRGLGARI